MKMRRLLTILLTIALLAGVFPASVFAVDTQTNAVTRDFDVTVSDLVPISSRYGYPYYTATQVRQRLGLDEATFNTLKNKIAFAVLNNLPCDITFALPENGTAKERNDAILMIADMIFSVPEFFFVATITPEFFLQYDENGDFIRGEDGHALSDCVFHFNYRDDFYSCISLYEIFHERVESILRPIRANPNLTDVEKALLVHDYLISMCSLDLSDKTNVNPSYDSANRADGVIIYRTATCHGYALAYAYLLERLGVSCSLNRCISSNRTWNTVVIDGEEYFVDVAADETVFEYGGKQVGHVPGKISHKTFLRSYQSFLDERGNIEIYGSNWTTRPNGTKYDAAFWQEVETQFCLVVDKIYYLDKKNTIYAWSNNVSEKLCSIPMNKGGIYNLNMLLTDGANLFYLGKSNGNSLVYRLNPDTKVAVVEHSANPLVPLNCTVEVIGISVAVYPQGMRTYSIINDKTGGMHDIQRHSWNTPCKHKNNDEGKTALFNCSTGGVKVYTCVECGCRSLEYLPAKGEHTKVTVYGKSATCTESGMTDGVACAVCGEVFEEQKVIPPTGHLAYCVALSGNGSTILKTSCTICGKQLEYIHRDEEATPDLELIHSYKYTPNGSVHMELCSVCGETGKTSEHHYDSGKVTTEPTCGKAGVMTYTCADCFGTKTESIAASTKHDWEIAEQTEYSTIQRCKGCGHYRVQVSSTVGDEIISIMMISAEHVPVITAAVASTCKTAGSSESCYCKQCGKVFLASYALPKTDHVAVTDRRVEPTCSRTGLTEGSHCKHCGLVFVAQKVINKTKHRAYCVALSNNGSTTLKTNCIYCGKQLEYIHRDEEATPDLELIHSYKYTPNGSVHMETCTVCGESGGSSSHNYNSGKITTTATCVTKGVKTYTCLDCGSKKTETLSYGDHTWEVVEATENSKTYCCKHCGTYEVYMAIIMENPKPSITIRPNEHIPVIAPAVPATCTSTGLSEGCYCRVCGEILIAQKTIPMILHTPVTDAAVAPTCTSTGLTEGTHCGVCNKVLFAQVSVPVVAHTEGRIALVAPTCTESGLTAGTQCIVCGKVLVAQQVLPALRHRYTDGVCVCGEEQGVILDENITMLHSLNLTSGIEINFVVPVAQLEGYDSYYLECVSQVSGEAILLIPVRNGNYYYFTLDKLTAFKMNDLYDATLHMTKSGTRYVSNVDSYSVAEYAYAQLNLANSGDKMKRLCADLLQYGAAAQTWKNYRLDALATDAMTQVHKGYLTDPTGVTFTDNYNVLNDIENPQINIVRKTLSVESKIVVRYVVDATKYLDKLDQLSLRITYQGADGTEKTVILDECENYIAGTNYYVFDLEALLAAELRTVITAAVYEGDTQISTTMQYSVDTYGVSATGTVRALCQAMLAYGDSAFAYFG